ncbi:carboxypeptidase-like regulatory domain-containing protein [Hymenobacter caeli]|uniref:Carboxypeptidase-like regulatory domain-containing protein n=1 Tax=Hymenobacter caeli TaxID=2735894 RepID=A0ABX2FRN2_9BACT|nr:carboxypeptidase-like regulatory domain-containing protein [Hymenobacter caeli]NRT19845.1 hypothetical protein [Hymenobacter caeli]
MKLTASPFDAATGTLLPVYRDAYLRGDLSHQGSAAVDAHLKTDRLLANDTLHRLHAMQQQGEQVRPVGWVQRQLELVRTEPQRFRRRAAALVAGALLVAGASMATSTPAVSNLAAGGPAAEPALAGEASGAAVALVTVRGRILDENGRPLVGATVLDKRSGRGAGTDANGNYALRVPAALAGTTRLQFGYGGYAEDEVQLKGKFTQNMTLVPRDAAGQDAPAPTRRHRWLFF